jgi:hypothetical protein
VSLLSRLQKAASGKDYALPDDDVLAFLRALDQHLYLSAITPLRSTSRICFSWRESRQLAAAVPCPSG